MGLLYIFFVFSFIVIKLFAFSFKYNFCCIIKENTNSTIGQNVTQAVLRCVVNPLLRVNRHVRRALRRSRVLASDPVADLFDFLHFFVVFVELLASEHFLGRHRLVLVVGRAKRLEPNVPCFVERGAPAAVGRGGGLEALRHRLDCDLEVGRQVLLDHARRRRTRQQRRVQLLRRLVRQKLVLGDVLQRRPVVRVVVEDPLDQVFGFVRYADVVRKRVAVLADPVVRLLDVRRLERRLADDQRVNDDA
jgi:hypothetical protein